MAIDQTTRDLLERFALDHKVILVEDGSVGIGRHCVGFMRGNAYIDYGPLTRVREQPGWRDFEYRRPEGFPYDARLEPPDGAPDAYHKHDCLAVLIRRKDDEHVDDARDRALRQLALWVASLNAVGVEVASYPTGADGLHEVAFHGLTAWAIRAKQPPGE